jgi:glycosyltransferase involved in cell wall biosynthesis
MDVFFWQNIPSHIQAPALRELAAIWDEGMVHGVWCDRIGADRRALGWQDPEFGELREILLCDEMDALSTAKKLIDASGDSIHIFSGLAAYPVIHKTYQYAVTRGRKNLGIMVEPGIQIGWRGLLRPLRAKWLAKEYRPHVKLVLAMGSEGMSFYQRAGFEKKAIAPFLYQSETVLSSNDSGVEDPLRLIYVGKFIKRKGFDVLLRALHRCRRRNWRLTVAGADKHLPTMQRFAVKLGLDEKIDWLGAVPSGQIPHLLSNHDLCVVPSRYEGWGVLTNEAIQAGLGVMVSGSVTSRDLVLASNAGEIFQTGSSVNLAGRIDRWLSNPQLAIDAKKAALEYRRNISPCAIGRYLADTLLWKFGGAARPPASWMPITNVKVC